MSGDEKRSFYSSLRGTVRNSHRAMLWEVRELRPPMPTSAISHHAQGDCRSTATLTLLNTYSVLGTLHPGPHFSLSDNSEVTSPIAIVTLTQKD